MIRLIICT